MDVLGDQVKEEEIVEGMQDEDGHTHEEEHTHDDDLEYDEHVWLSLKNASLFCDTIASSLADVDPEHSRLYQQNAEAYEEKLAALDPNTRHQWRNPSQKPCFLQIVSRSAI